MQLTLKRFFQRVVPACLCLSAVSFPSTAATLTFEDLPDPASDSMNVPDGYGGIEWSAGNWQYYGEAQSPYTPHSGSNRIFSYSADNTFSFITAPAYFDGAWFAGGSGTGDTVQFQLFLGGAPVHTSPSLYLTEIPAFLASDYSGLVDAVSIVENPVVRPTDTDFVMDDVTFRDASTVPEPSTTGLLVTGLGMVIYLFRRK